MVVASGEEEAMTYYRSICIVLTAMLTMAAAPAFPADDELFDTATASKHMEQGISCLKEKSFDAAIREFDESARIAPEAEAYYYLGYAYYMKSRKNAGEGRIKSLENFEKAYEIDPNFSPARLKTPEPAAQPTSKPSTTEVTALPQSNAPRPPAPEQPKP
jgi:tetratricopeptide (TPR) repeat protein